MLRPYLLLTATALGAACVSRTVTPHGIDAATTPDAIEAVARLAVSLDANADRGADTLYTPDAVVVANARARLAAPRLAGVATSGQVTVTAATVTLQGRFSWGMLDYRGINAPQSQAEAARAGLVVGHRERAWKELD